MGQGYEFQQPQEPKDWGDQRQDPQQDGARNKMWSDVKSGARGLWRKVERGVEKIPTEPIKRNAESIGGSVARVGEQTARQYQTPDGGVDGGRIARDAAPYFIPGLGPAKAIAGIAGLGGGGSILRNMGIGIVDDQIKQRRMERDGYAKRSNEHDVIRYQNRDPYTGMGGQSQRYESAYPVEPPRQVTPPGSSTGYDNSGYAWSDIRPNVMPPPKVTPEPIRQRQESTRLSVPPSDVPIQKKTTVSTKLGNLGKY